MSPSACDIGLIQVHTSADHADMAILVVRTNWDVPKHRGITRFVLDRRQDGVQF